MSEVEQYDRTEVLAGWAAYHAKRHADDVANLTRVEELLADVVKLLDSVCELRPGTADSDVNAILAIEPGTAHVANEHAKLALRTTTLSMYWVRRQK